jgi:hypothetical protein
VIKDGLVQCKREAQRPSIPLPFDHNYNNNFNSEHTRTSSSRSTGEDETMDIVVPDPEGEDEVVIDIASAQKIVADLKIFDDSCGRQFPETKRKRDFPVADVKVLGSDLAALPTGENKTFLVPYMKEAALVTTDADITVSMSTPDTPPQFYRRNEVDRLWGAVQDHLKPGKILFVRGPPGIGKSTAIWRKLLSMAAMEEVGDSNILWISLDHLGEPKSAVYFQGRHYHKFKLEKREIRLFLTAAANYGLPLDTLVVDGINQQVSAELITDSADWIHADELGNRKAIFSSSSKVEEMRSHQNTMIIYLTIHSWSLEDFQRACVEDGQPTTIYHQYSEVMQDVLDSLAPSADEDASTSEGEESSPADDTGTLAAAAATAPIDDSNKEQKVYTQGELESEPEEADEGSRIMTTIEAKYWWSGGSARWMFNYSRLRIENLLRQYCDKTANRDALLMGHIGPTSDASTNYFFGSSMKNDNMNTEYFLVSQQAVRILAESASNNTFEILYACADHLDNPAFVGWVVEAEFFFQLDVALKQKAPFEPLFVSGGKVQPISVLPYDHTKHQNLLLKTLSSRKVTTRDRALKMLKSIASSFVPNLENAAIAGKPVNWIQGGYDVFFVERAPGCATPGSHIYIRFGQVTTGVTRDLKAGYLYDVLHFFEKAGYIIDGVEIAFLLTSMNRVAFHVKGVESDKALQKYFVYNRAGEKWSRIEDSNVTKYELPLSKGDW